MGQARGAEAVTGAYTPRGVPAEAAAFARAVVAQAAPQSPARAKAWLFAASRAAAFALSAGLELSPAVVLSTSMVERFILSVERTVSHPTRRTLRSSLKTLAARLGPGPTAAPLGRERAKAPYAPAEIAAYLALADAQPSEGRRMRAVGLICLGAGAGLAGADLRAVTGRHIMARSGGLVVEVSGAHRRAVPVLACYHDRLVEVAGFFGDRFIVGGAEPSRRNVTSALISSLSGGADLGRLDMGRVRSTWLAAVASQIGLRAFMDAAGIVCSQRLGDIVAGLAPLDETQAVSMLGGVP